MNVFKFVALALVIASLAACTKKAVVRPYNGPEVTYVVVNKGARRMYLFHHDRVLESYPIALGFTAEGHKQFEGDGKTPEGHYRIDRRNPDSAFHLSIGISYPNQRDIAFAESRGKSPGGDIFIHGLPNDPRRQTPGDWTAGCISVSNREMEQIYAMVRNGTPIVINP